MIEGELLTGDSVTEGIVRIGDTVRWPLRPFSLTGQELTEQAGVGWS